MEKTIERYYELFTADYQAGTLRWRVSAGSRAKAGDRAGGIRPDGYRRVTVDGALTREHRVIVSMIEGRVLDADEIIDHVNGVRDDNRIENLRVGTQSENLRNGRVHRAGQPVGVTWCNQHERRKARVQHEGRMRHIILHLDQTVAARAFEIVDTMLKSGHTFDEAKAAARMECLS